MLLTCFMICVVAVASERRFIYGTFPDNFAWSTATSAYQIEGAWNTSGKGESIWDTFSHAGRTDGGATGDIACDSYNKYLVDVELLKNLSVNSYRFSLSWPRILPDGTINNVNQDGVDYYNKLINALLANNITPQVTLYHWDLPQAIDDQGGWLNDTMIDLFNDYADFVFKTFGDRVKFWITFNEPWIICNLGYNGAFAPGKSDMPGYDPYTCAHILIKSHAKAWHTYNTTYRSGQKGQCGITLNTGWAEPHTPADREASKRAMEFDLGWFANPIFSENGDYPAIMKERVANRSMQQGLTKSRLPEFTADQITYIKGSSDFFGLNFYSGGYCTDVDWKNNPWDNKTQTPNVGDDKATGGAPGKPEWTPSGSSWLFSTPEFMRSVLVYIKDTYNKPITYVTENGFSDRNGSTTDPWRTDYYKYYINNVLQAISDGCDVRGYTAWSLMDNFEWARGYAEKFGLHYVDFNDPDRPRKMKDSAKFYKSVIENHGFPDPAATTTVQPTTTVKPTTDAGRALAPLTGLLFILAAIPQFM